MSLSKIILASPTLSAITAMSLGDGLLMSASLASRTAAMMQALINRVSLKLQCITAEAVVPYFGSNFSSMAVPSWGESTLERVLLSFAKFSQGAAWIAGGLAHYKLRSNRVISLRD